MIKNIVKSFSFLLVVLAISLTSCNKEDTSNIDDYSDADFLVSSESRSIKDRCFELVFPITFLFPDETSVEINSLEELKSTLMEWREGNIEGRPTLDFPIDVILKNGEIKTINNRMEMRRLRKKCRRHHKRCFTINFPIEIEMPNGEIVQIADRKALKTTFREWKMENQGATERPHFVFPLTITLEDGTSVSVESKEEIMALKKDCKG